MSESRLRTLFGQAYGMSPVQYLTELRLNRVKTLLAESDKKLSEIAVECGFGEAFYLSRVFTRRVGISPSAYRAQSSHDF